MTPTNACLDAETLATWVEGGLSRHEAALAEAHVSSCPRCQEITGLIVKTTPVAAARAPWWRARAAWLVPLTAGVAAVGLWIMTPTTPAPSPTPSATMAAREPAREAGALAKDPAPQVQPEKRDEKQREARANTAADAAAPTAAAPAAAAPQPMAAGRVATEQTARQSPAPAAAKQAVAPDGALHWRITDRGALERSSDGGATWQAVNVGITATFTTVQAPTPGTALVTTADGRVFRTTDGGATWRLQEI